MGDKTKSNEKNINASAFTVAIVVLLGLMILTYVLTFFIPGGMYERTIDANGNAVVDIVKGFTYVEGGIPFWKWILSPILVLAAPGNATVIAVLIFLTVIGGIFNCLDKCGMMVHMLNKIVAKYGSSRYVLMAVVMGFFMAMGSFVGSFEECVPLVPIVASLAVGLGWDKKTGLGMSIIAVGCGFASGVVNPFTIGVAQKIAGVPIFSGMWFRLVSAALIYVLLLLFIRNHAKKIEKPVEDISLECEENKKMDRAVAAFAIILGLGILIVLSSSIITALQDYTMIIVALMFLIAGILSSALSGMKVKDFLATFGKGVINYLPGLLLILMASSIRYILEEACIMDTILHSAADFCSMLPKPLIVLVMYLVALLVNFFVASGSAEAVLLMPILAPLSSIMGISSQVAILAYVYGDGFSNVVYPTNAVLLISLGLTGVGYGEYLKWSWKLHLMILTLTGVMLLAAYAIGY